jgi:peptide/nickel transport system substrate-binding protein
MSITALPVGQIAATAGKQRPDAVFFYYTYSDPDIVMLLLHKGAPFDFSWQNDPALDRWMEQQRVTFNQAKRTALLHKIQQRIAQQAYYLMLWEGMYSVAAQNYVKNIHIDLVGFIHLQEIERT